MRLGEPGDVLGNLGGIWGNLRDFFGEAGRCFGESKRYLFLYEAGGAALPLWQDCQPLLQQGTGAPQALEFAGVVEWQRARRVLPHACMD